MYFFFFSSRRRHTRWTGDWSSDVCSSDLSTGMKRCSSPYRRNPCTTSARYALSPQFISCRRTPEKALVTRLKILESRDRKSTRLNSSHPSISYAVFCLKKKKKENTHKIHE